MKNFSFWQRWLLVISILILIGGASISLLSSTLIFNLFDQLIVPTFWHTKPISDEAMEFQKFIYAVLGATMAGWGVNMIFIAHIPFRNRELWAWNCMLVGSLTWFILDTGFSWYHQAYVNVVLNTVLLILIGLPVVFTRKYFPLKITNQTT